MAKRKSLFERITAPFRGTKETKEVQTTTSTTIQNERQQALNYLTEQKIVEAKEIIKNIDTTERTAIFNTELASDMSEEKLFEVYRQMDNDSIISSALDLFADNATQVNTKTGHVASVESNNKSFQDEVNEFLWDIVKIDTEAWNYARSIAKYGKVIIDTKASNGGRDWSFIEVEKPEYILPLTYGQDIIKYHAVVEDLNELSETETTYRKYNTFYNKQKQLETVIEEKDRYLVGFNARKHLGKMKVKTKNPLTKEEITEELYVRGGKSFLEGVVETWRILSTLEDSMFISRLVKSKAFNLVTIDVSDANTKQSREMVESVKRSLRSAETIDKTAQRYSNRTSPLPANDFVYVAKKGEKGVVTIEQVGGEVGAQDLSDIEYMRNKLFAGLGVLKAYLGFEETTPGGLGDTTLTMLDERFSRKVKRLRTSLSGLINQIVEYYWLNSSVSRTLENMPEYNIILGKISTAEEKANREELLENIDVANEILNLTSAFEDRVDEEKLFNYIFNDIIGIDPANFDKKTEAKDIIVKANYLGEDEINDLIDKKIETTRKNLIESKARRRRPKRQKVNGNENTFNVLTGKPAELLMDQPIEEILKEYEIYLEDNKGRITSLHNALDNKYLRRSLTEATYKDLKQRTQITDPVRIKKSKKLTGRYLGLDDNNFIVFRVSAEDPSKNRAEGKPTSYETKVHLKALLDIIEARRAGETDLNLVRDAIQDDVAVACDCPASKYWGQQYNGTKEGYSIVKNTIEPTRNKQYQTICKHVATLLTLLPFWSNTIVRDLRAKGLLTQTSQAKKDKVEVDTEEYKDKVNTSKEKEADKNINKDADKKDDNLNTNEEQEQSKEEKLASKAPKTKRKANKDKTDETETEPEAEEMK